MLRYAVTVLWKKTWEIETVLALIGGIVATWFLGNAAALLLHAAKAPGFVGTTDGGAILLATASGQGAAIIFGTLFLKFHGSSWREVLGTTPWPRCLAVAVAVLAVIVPVMFALKFLSAALLLKLHFQVEDQQAIKLIQGAKSWVSAYLVLFTVVIAPVGEEFFFRGLLYSTAKRLGWPKLGWIGVSLLFALIHFNAPIFLPLFLLALALTWLCERTEGLLAPILAHSAFNTANLVLLVLAEKYLPAGS